MRQPTKMRQLSVAEFYRALKRYGLVESGTHIIDVSGRCPNGSWPVALNSAGKIDHHRTIRNAVKERTDEIARRANGKSERG